MSKQTIKQKERAIKINSKIEKIKFYLEQGVGARFIANKLKKDKRNIEYHVAKIQKEGYVARSARKVRTWSFFKNFLINKYK